jgi:hypothetical protein
MPFFQPGRAEPGKKTGAVLAAPENIPKEEDLKTRRLRVVPSLHVQQFQCQNSNQYKSRIYENAWT